MPLSERERRLLEEMERSFYSSDSDVFASDPARRGRTSYRLLVIGILLALVGLGAVAVGIATHLALIGIAGFVIVLGGVVLATTRRRGTPASSGEGREGSSKAKPQPFMDRLADRWDRRSDEGR